MPRRDDIQRIMLIGSGPIVIGQACEFDYSGTQGAKALKQEGYEVILVNSNPATVMTDPEFADRTYVEPLDVGVLRSIIEREKPDAILPTLGGQTALNLALALQDAGVLEEFGIELIGASVEAIRKAEDRELFNDAMAKIGLSVAKSRLARTIEEAEEAVEVLGFPLILRPSFTLGGSGGGGSLYFRGRHYPLSVGGIDYGGDGTGWPPLQASRRELEQVTRREQTQLVDFMDHAPIGFFSVDQDGHFQFVNATLAKWLGCAPEDLVEGGRRLHDVLAHPPAGCAPWRKPSVRPSSNAMTAAGTRLPSACGCRNAATA